jgi:hypothetical protein
MQRAVEGQKEHYFPSNVAVSEGNFIQLGLTDSTLGLLAREKVLILTDDLPLYAKLDSEGMPVMNFAHFCSAAYGWESSTPRWLKGLGDCPE